MSTDERVWEDKPALRAIYRAYCEEIRARCQPGQTLEIGGGSGNLENFMPAVISTDFLSVPWLDAQADAQRLPALLLVSTISRCLTCCTISSGRACSSRRPNAC